MYLQKKFLPSEERPKRASISPDDIKRVQKVCLDIADERKLIIALIFDTGIRLSEALRLVWDDMNIQHQYPHINLVPHLWKPLKTVSSTRLTPLVGAPYEAIKIMHRQRTNRFMFNTYPDKNGSKGNSR